MKKGLLFLSDGFEEVEALAPLDILRRAGLDVKMVSVTNQRVVRSSHDVVVEADLLWENLGAEDRRADFYFLPGGMPNAETLANHQGLATLIKEANDENKVIAAICAAPMALGKWGLLKGKEAICYPGFERYLEGARISEHPVIRDGNMITGRGVGVALEFGYLLLEALSNPNFVEDLKKKMVFGK